MNASPSPSLATDSPSLLAQLGRWSTITAVIAIGCFFLLLVVRQVSFATDPWPHAAPVVMLAWCGVFLMALSRLVLIRTLPRQCSYQQRLVAAAAPSACLALMALSLSLGRLSSAAVTAIWLGAVADGVAAFLWSDHRWASSLRRFAARTSDPTPLDTAMHSCSDAHATSESDALISGSVSESVYKSISDSDSIIDESSVNTTQTFSRWTDPELGEVVTGILRGQFDSGSRLVLLHVGFCPQMPALPDLQFEQIEGPEADIKLAQLYPHGARFDVKLRRPASTKLCVTLEFHAAAKQASDSPSFEA